MTKNIVLYTFKLPLLQILCGLLLLAPKQGISQGDSGLPFNEVKVSMSYIPSLANKGDLLGIYRYTDDHDENERLDCGCWVKQTSQGEANAREYSMAHIGGNFWYLYRDNSRCSPNAISGLMGATAPDDPCNPIVIPKIDPYGPLQVALPDGTTLYVHPETQAAGIYWGPNDNDIPNLDNEKTPHAAIQDFDGKNNTKAILTALGDFNGPAKVCDDLVAFGYDDWYLPALGELNAIYAQLIKPQERYGFVSNDQYGYYWSSTEKDASYVWRKSFRRGNHSPGKKEGNTEVFACRCVRK